MGRSELVEAVLLRSTHRHPGPDPLLAGPVELVRAGGLVGSTEIGFTAPGVAVSLGWGPDPALRVVRTVRQVKEEPGLLAQATWTPKRIQRYEVELAFSNLGSGRPILVVEDRIPVSELEGVEIEFDATATTPPVKPDADGTCRWTLTLVPHGRAEVLLRWRQRSRTDLVMTG